MVNRIIFSAFIFLGVLMGAQYSFAASEAGSGLANPVDSRVSSLEEVASIEKEEGTASAASEAASLQRDPFWPVGYTPRPSSTSGSPRGGESAEAGGDSQSALDLAGLTAEEQQVIKQRMRLGGVLQQAGEIWAILNNQLVKQGETVKIDTGRKVYVFLVKQLTPERIVLESHQDS